MKKKSNFSRILQDGSQSQLPLLCLTATRHEAWRYPQTVTSDIYLERFVVLLLLLLLDIRLTSKQGVTREYKSSSTPSPSLVPRFCVVKMSLEHGHASVFPPSKAVYLWTTNSRNEMVPYSGRRHFLALSSPIESEQFYLFFRVPKVFLL